MAVSSDSTAGAAPPPPTGTSNSAPTISGIPLTTIKINESYSLLSHLIFIRSIFNRRSGFQPRRKLPRQVDNSKVETLAI